MSNPIGLMPKDLFYQQRFIEVCEAITRYYQAGFEIPIEWVEEYNEIMRDKNKFNISKEYSAEFANARIQDLINMLKGSKFFILKEHGELCRHAEMLAEKLEFILPMEA